MMPNRLTTIERRIYPTEFRAVTGTDGRQKWATAVTYNQVDDYGTLWLPGCFNTGLDERMPTVLYGHDWWQLEHVLGQGVDYQDTPGGCDVLIEFADPAAVPNAGLAIALVSGDRPVLRDVSVGFSRSEWIRKDDLTPEQLAMGAEEAIVTAEMDELSIVIRGAVPGAQLRGRRSWLIDGRVLVPAEAPPAVVVPPVVPSPAAPTVALDDVVALAKKIGAGELSQEEAKTALALLADEPAPTPVVAQGTGEAGEAVTVTEGEQGEVEGDGTGAALPPVDHAALDAEIDAALAMVDRGRR